MKQNGNRAAALAAQFKKQAKAITSQTVEVKLPVPEIAPDFVFEFIGRRVDIMTMLYSGVLPESLARALLEKRRAVDLSNIEDSAIEMAEEMSADEQLAILDFQRKIACEVCVAPKLVFREPASAEEIDLRDWEHAGKLIVALFNYAMRLSPDVPVATTDGGAEPLKAVESFRPE